MEERSGAERGGEEEGTARTQQPGSHPELWATMHTGGPAPFLHPGTTAHRERGARRDKQKDRQIDWKGTHIRHSRGERAGAKPSATTHTNNTDFCV